MSESFISPRGPEPVGPYPHCKRIGNLLFVSGLGPRIRGRSEIPGVTRDASGKVTDYDIEAQCRAVFDNLRYCLEDAGSSWDRIADILVFLTDMQRDFPTYNKVYAEYFAGEGKPYPTRTTVEVTALPTQINIEIKAIATIG